MRELDFEKYTDFNPEFAALLQQDFTLPALSQLVVEHAPEMLAKLTQTTPSVALLSLISQMANRDVGTYFSTYNPLSYMSRDANTHPDVLLTLATSGNADKLLSSLVDNPSTPTAALVHLFEQYQKHIGEPGSNCTERLTGFAAHVNSSPSMLYAILNLTNAEVVYIAAAKNPSTPPALLEDLSQTCETAATLTRIEKTHHYLRANTVNVTFDKVKRAVAGNPSARGDTLRTLFLLDKDRSAVVCNPALPLAQALHLLQDDALQDEAEGYTDVSEAQAALCLVDMLKTRSDAIELPEWFSSVSALTTLFSMGYPLSELSQVRKVKEFVRQCIGSAHKEEVAFLLRGVTLETSSRPPKAASDNRHLGLASISALQGIFTQTRKLDRHGYLEFMRWLNENEVQPAALCVSVDALQATMDTIGLMGIKCILVDQRAHRYDEAGSIRDTFGFIYSLVSHEDDAVTLRQRQLITRWLEKNDDEYGVIFHDYLMNKCKRDLEREILPASFYQARYRRIVETINHELQQQKRNERIYWPVNSSQLKTLGSTQRHCVGGGAYAAQCVSGRSIIFALKVDGALKHGFTFQFDAYTNTLVQAEGFCRARPDDNMVSLAQSLYARITNAA